MTSDTQRSELDKTAFDAAVTAALLCRSADVLSARTTISAALHAYIANLPITPPNTVGSGELDAAGLGDPRWQKLRDLFGLDGWHDGHFNGMASPDQIVTHIEYVANERARLLVAALASPVDHPEVVGPATAYQRAEERLCTCSAAGSGEGHTEWCAWQSSEWRKWGDAFNAGSDVQNDTSELLIRAAKVVYSVFRDIPDRALPHNGFESISLLGRALASLQPSDSPALEAGVAEELGRFIVAHAIEVKRSSALATALRNIAEGNLGDAPWQANYDKIRAVAAAALSIPATESGK